MSSMITPRDDAFSPARSILSQPRSPGARSQQSISFPPVSSRSSRAAYGFPRGAVSTATITKLLRAKLNNNHDELTKLLTGGAIEVANAALCCTNFDKTRTRGRYTGRALCPHPSW